MNRIKCTGTNYIISACNSAIQLGDQGGRGEECSKVAQSPVCAPVNAWRWHSHNIHLNQECVLMSIFGGGANNLHLQLCMCAHVHAWRWHSDTATISILNCVCVLMSMLISTLKLAHVNAWRWHSHNLDLDPRVCVRMSMIGGGIATISILNRECSPP